MYGKLRFASGILRYASVDTKDKRFLALLERAIAKVPEDVIPMRTVGLVHLKTRGPRRGLVGLTRWAEVGDAPGKGRQTITFYTNLLYELSEDAAMGVIAHELAHAWLNEHIFPESSEEREKRADNFARRWGFGRELDALESETEAA